MGHFAKLFNEDVTKWSIIGLVHDLDYEMYPNEHCARTKEILEEENWPEDYIHAIISHGWKLCYDVEPISKMEITLYTIDELTGLINAAALMRPSKSVLDMEVKSIKKKWKQKGFASGINRDVIEDRAKMLEMDLDFIIEETIKGMQAAAEDIGLKGGIYMHLRTMLIQIKAAKKPLILVSYYYYDTSRKLILFNIITLRLGLPFLVFFFWSGCDCFYKPSILHLK